MLSLRLVGPRTSSPTPAISLPYDPSATYMISAELTSALSDRGEAGHRVVDDIAAFLNALPTAIRAALEDTVPHGFRLPELVEVVIDLGRRPEARYISGARYLSDGEMTRDDIDQIINRLGKFGDDNRAGIERTLHRFSVIRDREGLPVGLTCRVGRAVFGSVKLIEDLIQTGRSVLILGRPGVGKTTILREVARVLADDSSQRVIVVDTSNEIAGDGAVPHPAIGRARRMQVPNSELQHKVMIEAVENHMPEVVVIDEMSTELETLSARTIAERGVQLVATAHGNTLGNVILNPTLADLVGGTHTVTLGDIEARRRRTQKTVLERKHTPTFDVVVEMRERNDVRIHRDVGNAVDRMLRGLAVPVESRRLADNGEVVSGIEDAMDSENGFETASFDVRAVRSTRSGEREEPESPEPKRLYGPDRRFFEDERWASPEPPAAAATTVHNPAVRIHSFGVPKDALRSVIKLTSANAKVIDSSEDADVFVTTKLHYGRRPPAVKRAERDGVPVYVLRRNTREQIAEFVSRFESIASAQESANGSADGSGNGYHDAGDSRPDEEVERALEDTHRAVERVLSGERKVSLKPQSAYVRRLQHGLAAKYNVGSASAGREPGRHVVIRRRRR